jgi:hypothetical protein
MRSTESASQFRDFAARLLEHEGALVDSVAPAGLEAMLPASVQQALRAPEFVRLGFAADLPADAQRVSLESDWLDRFGHLLGERGRLLQCVVNPPLPVLSHPERMLEHGLVLQNAVYRLSRVTPAWTRYLILLFRYTAISDEKREGLIKFGLNLANGSAIDPFVDELLTAAISMEVPTGASALSDGQRLPHWEPARLHTVVTRALPTRVRTQLHLFLHGMQRRLERDLARLHEYYTGLRQEAWQRLQKQPSDAARERLRFEAAEREYHNKVTDLRQKYALRVTVDLEQTLELTSPVQRLELTIKRRKGERSLILDWNPLARRLDPPPCEWRYTSESTRVVCDDTLHLVSPAGHAPCVRCDKSYCRACHPLRCPKCGQGE